MPFGLTGFKLIAILVAVAAIVGSLIYLRQKIYNDGYNAGYAKLTEYIEEQGQATRETERIVEKIVEKVEVVYVDKIKVIKERGKDIIVKVPVYINKADDAACELRAGSVSIHEASARNRAPEPPSESNRNPSDVKLSEVMRTVAENYTLYYACREQVIGWVDFWAQYSDAIKSAVCVPK